MAKAPHGSTLELTTTDIDALYGKRAGRMTRRMYAARLPAGKRVPFFRELGVRLLLGAAVRAANRQGRGCCPLLAVASEHWAHVSLRVEKGGRAADEAEARVRPWRRCLSHGTGFATDYEERETATAATATGTGTGIESGGRVCPDCGSLACARDQDNGPIWVGRLFERGWVEEMLELAALPKTSSWFAAKTIKTLQTLAAEAQVPPRRLFYQRPEALGQLPKLSAVVEELAADGFAASRTHFDPLAIRTDAPPPAFAEAVRRARRSGNVEGGEGRGEG